MIKAWVIGAGGTRSYNCDGGGSENGEQSTAGIIKAFVNSPLTFNTSIGTGISYTCDLDGNAPSTTLTLSQGSMNPNYSGPFVSTGGIHRGFLNRRDSINFTPGFRFPSVSGVVTQDLLWDRNGTGVNLSRLYPDRFSEALTLAGITPSEHTLGARGVNSTNLYVGGDGGILMLFTDYENITLAFFGSGNFVIPEAYSSAKIWSVGGGGVGYIYCDGGSNDNGGQGSVAVKTFNAIGGQTLTYNVAPAVTNTCNNPANGAATVYALNGTTITAGGGLSNGTNGSASGSYDNAGIATENVDGLLEAYNEAEVFTRMQQKYCTITIANPAVLNTSNFLHGLVAGDIIKLSTDGSLPTGLNTQTTYYVISEGLTSSTFRISDSPQGQAIVTSGSQSGNHSYFTKQRAYGFGNVSGNTFALGDKNNTGIIVVRLTI
jgi:hypothetical protein